MYSKKDFKIIINFLNSYNINYDNGNYYDGDSGAIIGHWIKIDADLESNELTFQDKEYNEN